MRAMTGCAGRRSWFPVVAIAMAVAALDAPRARGQVSVIDVLDLTGLYQAVNDPANAGMTIRMAPGYYALNPAFPNGGRLELQENMSLSGQVDHPEAVVIDAAALTKSEVTDGMLRTGPVRVGRGRNTIEGLTIQNDLFGTGLIESDLTPTAAPSRLVVSHVNLRTGTRGIDFRLISTLYNNRTADAVFDSNQIQDIKFGVAEGIRIFVSGPDHVTVTAALDGNLITGTQIGLLVSSQRTRNTVEVSSWSDRFIGNRAGCWLIGGLGAGSSENYLHFTAWNDVFTDNNLPSPVPPNSFTTDGGIVAIPGAQTADHNTELLEVFGGTFSNNADGDILLYGYYDLTPNVPVGSNNALLWRASGLAPSVNLSATPSDPAEPNGQHTNTITALPAVVGPARLWVGLKNSDDVGTKFDLLAEVLNKDDVLVASGELHDVAGGSSGFNNARLDLIDLTLTHAVEVSQGQTLTVRLSARVAASSTHTSGTARLWYNDGAANSRLDTDIAEVARSYFLAVGGALGTSPGMGPKLFNDVLVSRSGGNPFKRLGEWTIVF